MTEKSDLDWLLEALESEHISRWNQPAAVADIKDGIRRAIERRKQDLAKEVDNGDVQGLRGGYQYECDTRKDNTPKGGGDVKRYCGRCAAGSETAAMNPMVEWHEDGGDDQDTPYVLASDYDAARTDLKEAVGLLTEARTILVGQAGGYVPGGLSDFLDRVGKQP